MSRTSHARGNVGGAFGQKSKLLEGISDVELAAASAEVEKKKELHLNAGLELELYRDLVSRQDKVLQLMQDATQARNEKQVLESLHTKAKEKFEDARADHDDDPSMATSQHLEAMEKDFRDKANRLAAGTSAHKTITAQIIEQQNFLERFGVQIRKQEAETHKQRKERTKRVCKAIVSGLGSNDVNRLQEALALPNARVMALIQSRTKNTKSEVNIEAKQNATMEAQRAG